MGRIFKGQSALRITVKTFSNLEEIEKAEIKYLKPNKKEGIFSAGVSDVERGLIFHECIEGDIDISGWWVFWALITFADGRTAAGEAAKVYVWDEGK
jgi:hypothetical protein